MKHLMKICAGICLCLYSVPLLAQFKYGEALQKSFFFYEAQQAGQLPDWNRVSWRDDSGLDHGRDVGLDLTGGWYDAGDHVKFNFPMASSVTMLAWGGIEYKDAYVQSGQMMHLKRNLRFVLDYMLRCHTAKNELYIQIGDGIKDHEYWGTAEVFPFDRISVKVDQSNPGSEVASEFAAAFAACSILFAEDDPSFSNTLIQHAKELYDFADKHRALYSDSYKPVRDFYRSWSGFQDELVWGAAWLYRATNDATYLTKAEQEYATLTADGAPFAFSHSWDDKSYGSYVLLAQLTDKGVYKTAARNHFDFWTVGFAGEKVDYSPGGQAHLVRWGSLRYAANTSFLASVFADKVETSNMLKNRYLNFAKGQADYALGDNPLNRSFVCGFGNNPANDPHHRGNHGSWDGLRQGNPEVASHILYGALVGGPLSPNDQFVDDRGDYIANEVATDYNAAFTGVLASLYAKHGGEPLANFPVEEVPTRDEIRSAVVYYYIGDKNYTPNIRFENRTAWPSRVTDQLTARYFFNISEATSQGYSIADFKATGDNVQIKAWDASKGIYYAEVSLVGEPLIPNNNENYKRDVNINIGVKSNAVPFNPANDWSAQGMQEGSSHKPSPNIPVYDNGVLVYGNEPGPGNGNPNPVNGGTISGGPFTFIVGDGTPDFATGVTLSGHKGDRSQWVVTDAQNNILALPNSVGAVNFDGSGTGVCFIWHLSYSDGLSGLATGNKTSALSGEFDFSNSIMVRRNPADGGGDGGDCAFGAPMASPLSTISEEYENIFILGTGGPAFDNVRKFDIHWNLENDGLYQFSVNTSNGVPNWYNDFTPNVTHNFASSQPEITISGSGFAGFDGAYYVAVHQGNFVMVSKSGGFTIYFSKTATAPDCDAMLVSRNAFNNLQQPTEAFNVWASPNPAQGYFNVLMNKEATSSIIHITDLSGKNYRTESVQNGNSVIRVSTVGLSSGVYILEVINVATHEVARSKVLIK